MWLLTALSDDERADKPVSHTVARLLLFLVEAMLASLAAAAFATALAMPAAPAAVIGLGCGLIVPLVCVHARRLGPTYLGIAIAVMLAAAAAYAAGLSGWYDLAASVGVAMLTLRFTHRFAMALFNHAH